jgi:putative SOS response-associated peptidase YedK
MCGRFTATFSFRDIKVRWNLQGDLSFEPRYNIAPSQSVSVILKGERGNEAKLKARPATRSRRTACWSQGGHHRGCRRRPGGQESDQRRRSIMKHRWCTRKVLLN